MTCWTMKILFLYENIALLRGATDIFMAGFQNPFSKYVYVNSRWCPIFVCEQTEQKF